MDKEELDKIKEQSNEVIRGVTALQEEIKKYKSGAESFELAVGVLAQVSEKEKEVAMDMKKLIAEMRKSSFKKTVDELEEIENSIEEASKKMVSEQKTEKRLEKEIKELRMEMSEIKILLENSKGKKGGIFGLFGKR